MTTYLFYKTYGQKVHPGTEGQKPLTLENLPILMHDACRLRSTPSGKMEEINKQKSHSNRVKTPAGESSHALQQQQSQQEETDSFPGKDSASEKHWTRFFVCHAIPV